MQFNNPRRFRVQQYLDSDEICRRKVVELFEKHLRFKAVVMEELYPEDPEVKFKADVAIVDRETGEHAYNIECEIKRKWIDYFPFHDVQFLERKKEKLDNPDFTYGRPTFFIIFNKTLDRHLVITHDVIRNLSDKRLVNCPVRGPEEMYIIPLDKVIFDYLK